jgi:uncharacterized protein YraI
MIRLALSCAMTLLAGAALAKPGVAISTVNLRAEANTTSAVLAKIPAGYLVDIGECKDGWCAVTFQDKNGFSIQTSLDASGKPRVVRRGPDAGVMPVAPGYGPRPPGYVVGPPVVYAPGPYYFGYGYGPYWGYGYRRWGYGYRRW